MKWIVIAAGLIGLVFVRPGYAEPGTGVIAVRSKLGPHDLAGVTGAIEDSVRAAGWSLIGQPLPAKAVEDVLACFFNVDAWPCISKIIAETVCDRDVGWIAAITLDQRSAPGGRQQVVISGRFVHANVRSFVVDQRSCEYCTEETLAALSGELIKGLLARTAVRRGRTLVSIKSTPTRARYLVDDAFGGVTDAVLDVAPGRHSVALELDGHAPATRTIQAEAGKTTEIAVSLPWLDTPPGGGSSGPQAGEGDGPSGRGAARRSRRVPATLIFTGGGAVLGSAILLAANQRPTTKPRGVEQPRGYYDTIPPSSTLLFVGGIVAIAGGYLWWKQSQSQRHTSEAVMVAPIAGGAVIGVHEAF